MPINSRAKGKRFELAIAKRLTDWSGVKVTRILDQARDGGHDLRLGRWRVECKAYASLGKIEAAMAQCEVGTREHDAPMVIAKSNNLPPIVAMRLDTFLDLMTRAAISGRPQVWE